MSKKEQQANWSYNSDDATTDAAAPTAQPAKKKHSPIEWTASEYIAHEKSTRWYLALFAGGGLLIVIVYAITRDFLATTVVLLSVTALSVFAGRQPATKRYLLDDNGIHIEDASYAYPTFRSFSIVEEGAIDSVWLKPIKRFTPTVVVYFSPDDGEKIVTMLADFLPYEERELDVIDRLSKRARF